MAPHKKVLASDYQTVVQDLYVSYYGRPADPAGLAYWEGVLLADNAPTDIADLNSAYGTTPAIKAVVNSFGNSAESQALYGTGTTTAFVTAIYNNALGRAPDQGGLTYWVGLIGNNQVTQAQAALSIIAGAAAEADTSSDEQLVANRIAVASDFTAQISAQNALAAYSGETASATARSMLSTVTNTTNVTDFQSTVLSTISSLIAANVSFPVDSTLSTFYSSPVALTSYYTDPATGNFYQVEYTSSTGSNTVFAGQQAQTARIVIALTENGNLISEQSEIEYFSTGPFKWLGATSNPANATTPYIVATSETPPPTAANLGSSGTISAGNVYTNSSMSSVANTFTESWSLTAGQVAGTASLCQVSGVCLIINSSGNILGFSMSETINGVSQNFGSAALPCGGNYYMSGVSGTGSNGLSFASSAPLNVSVSSTAAGQQATDSSTYSVSYANPNASSATWSGNIRVQLWAVIGNYTNANIVGATPTPVNGYLLSTLYPNLSGQYAYSSTQLYNGSLFSNIPGSATGTNPPAGTYCIAALLQENGLSCGASDGYCTIDWRNVSTPFTFQ